MSGPGGPSVVASNADVLLQRLAGKYLTFKLCGEEFAVVILKVQEIVRIQKITRLPRTPDFIRGLTNLRGKIIPVVDLRCKFGLPMAEDTEKTCIVIVQIMSGEHLVTMGMVVDEVLEVLDIRLDCIDETPKLGAAIDTSFILGIARMDESVILLLDIDRVLTAQQVSAAAFAAISATEAGQSGESRDKSEDKPAQAINPKESKI